MALNMNDAVVLLKCHEEEIIESFDNDSVPAKDYDLNKIMLDVIKFANELTIEP